MADHPVPMNRFILTGTPIEQDIKKSVEKDIKLQLGLKGNQKLSPDITALVTSASSAAAAKAIEVKVLKEAEQAARDLSAGDTIARFGKRVKLADERLQAVTDSKSVAGILKKRANMLAAKKSSLEEAGFTSEEAMTILLADIASRGA